MGEGGGDYWLGQISVSVSPEVRVTVILILGAPAIWISPAALVKTRAYQGGTLITWRAEGGVAVQPLSALAPIPLPPPNKREAVAGVVGQAAGKLVDFPAW